MPFSTAVDNAILDTFVNNVASWAAPSSGGIWVGLSSTTPTKTGTNVTEPSGGSYSRVQIAPSNWPSAASSTLDNDSEIAFPQATADWVSGSNLTHLVVYSAVTAGNFLGGKGVSTPKPVLSGDTAKIAAGEFDITMGGSF